MRPGRRRTLLAFLLAGSGQDLRGQSRREHDHAVVVADHLDKLIDQDQDFRLIGSGYGFTEGPAWNPAGNYLVFSDIPGDRRWRWSEAKGMELVAWPTYKGNGMAYEADGSLLVCEQVTSSLIRIRPDGLRQVVACHYQGKYLNSPNDVIVRSDRSIYATYQK